MSKADAVLAVGTLVLAYRQEAIPDETVALYAEKLADIPPNVLEAAVNRLIESVKFFPAISEIRQCAARLAGLLPATEAEALAIVRRADVARPVYRHDGSYAYTEREWAWPEGVDPLTMDVIRATLVRVGDPADGDGKAHFGWDTGFQKTYTTAVELISRAALADLSHSQLPAVAVGLLETGARQLAGVGAR